MFKKKFRAEINFLPAIRPSAFASFHAYKRLRNASAGLLSGAAFIYKSILISLNLLLIFSSFSCSKNPSPQELEEQKKLAEKARLEAIEIAKKTAITEYISSLSDEVKVSQLFLVNIEGNSKYSAVEKTGSLYGKSREGDPLLPGGVLLFSYNISKDPSETFQYISSIKDFYLENENLPPYAAVDQEGGDVNRLRGLTSVLWSQKKIADSFTVDEAEKLYAVQARQMKNLGFHMNLAPVAEVLTPDNQGFLDTRSFGNLEKVLSYGEAAVKAYEENGIATVLKHFPGNSNADPHLGLPKILYSESESEKYFKPFENFLPHTSAVLMSHAIMLPKDQSAVEKYQMPACFSKAWISEKLRNDYGFSGLILSDDIFMGALAKNGYPPEKAAVEAISAGVDVIMLSEKRFGNVAGIILSKAKEDPAFANEMNRAVENVIRYKIKAGILEIKEISPENLDFADKGREIPSFKVQLNQAKKDFDLQKFKEDYKAGMDIYN